MIVFWSLLNKFKSGIECSYLNLLHDDILSNIHVDLQCQNYYFYEI